MQIQDRKAKLPLYLLLPVVLTVLFVLLPYLLRLSPDPRQLLRASVVILAGVIFVGYLLANHFSFFVQRRLLILRKKEESSLLGKYKDEKFYLFSFITSSGTEIKLQGTPEMYNELEEEQSYEVEFQSISKKILAVSKK